MTIRCPLCGGACESDEEIPLGEHLDCPFCGNGFTYGPECLSNGVGRAQRESSALPETRLPKMPRLTLAGHIILYVFLGLSIFGNIGTLRGAPPPLVAETLGLPLLMMGLTIISRRGKNWARIAVTVIVGLLVASFFGMHPIAGLGCMILFAVPIVFIWLPCSNRWYRQVKAIRKASKG